MSENVFVLDVSVSELPPLGLGPGLFVDAYAGTGEDAKGKKFATLNLVVELAAKKNDGLPFTLLKTYSLTTRGKKSLMEDLAKWRGSPPTAQELKNFNPEAEFVGKNCMAESVYANEGGTTVAKLKSYSANSQGVLKVSANFVRHKDEAAAVMMKSAEDVKSTPAQTGAVPPVVEPATAG